jgi:hypothetical protein
MSRDRNLLSRKRTKKKFLLIFSVARLLRSVFKLLTHKIPTGEITIERQIT